MKTRLTALLLVLLCLTGCGGSPGSARALTETVTAKAPAARELTEEDAAALAEFSVELLKEEWEGEGVLLSPLSVLSALGMTAGGAAGETLRQMEEVLGLPAEELAAALAAWTAGLPEGEGCRVDLANSLWLRDDGTFEPDRAFLRTAAERYGAEVYASPFDGAAVEEINGWVEEETHGMIDGILEEIPEAAMLYLVNALALEARWETVYREDQVRDGRVFTTEDGREQAAAMMYSSEGHYLKDERAQGFLKYYEGGRWAFAALLPDEGVRLEELIASLTGERLRAILGGAEETLVYAAIPKFRCAYSAELSGSLEAMGMTDAFDMGKADFSGMGRSPTGPLFISKVLHKTYLSVDEEGTRAGAATAVEMASGGTMPGTVPEVYLDRPFLYMLVDTETCLPAFIGAVTGME